MQIENSDLTVSHAVIARAFQSLISDNNEMVVDRAAVHINRDPISGEYTFAVYTDDGNGNGDHILSLSIVEAN